MPSPCLSQDGSHTLYSDKFQAHYHSVFGAIEESIHVFIISGLYKLVNQGYKEVNVFEMGFGSGLNALLTLIEANKFDLKINYHTIEAYPVESEMIGKLNYCQELNCDTDIIHTLHDLPWNETHAVNPNFTFTKYHSEIESFKWPECHFDLVYWDAFAPNAQSHLWEEPIHKTVYNHMADYAVLVTYCTKGYFRRMMDEMYHSIERLNGPGKKREMLRATKSNA